MFKKQQFPSYVIQSIANNTEIYQKGQELYQTGQIQDIVLDIEDHSAQIYFQADGAIQVQIEFLNNGLASVYSCTCANFSRYTGACEHVVAGMLGLNKYQVAEIEHLIQPKQKQISLYQRAGEDQAEYRDKSRSDEQEKFLNHLLQTVRDTSFSSKEQRRPLKFEFTLNIQPNYNDEDNYHLYMRVGADHLYVVKMQEIGDIARKLLRGEPHYFGKQLTFSEDDYFIRSSERQILELIVHIAPLSHLVNPYESYYYSSSHLFNVHPIFIGQMIEALNRSPYSQVTIGNAPKRTTAIEGAIPLRIADKQEKLPIRLTIQKRDDDYVMKSPEFKGDPSMVGWVSSAQLLFIRDRFYRLTAEQIRLLKELIQMETDHGMRELHLSKDQLLTLTSRILPVIGSQLEFDLDESIQEQLQFEVLETRLNLDYEQGELTVHPIFQYGEEAFDALSETVKAEDHERITVRDLPSERAVRDQVFPSFEGYPVRDKQWVISDLDQIVEFMLDRLPMLEDIEHLTIYLSRSAEHLFYGSEESFPTIHIDHNKDRSLLDITFETVDISREEFGQIIGALQASKSFYRLNSGKIINLSDQPMQDLKDSLDTIGYTQSDYQSGKNALSLYEGLAIYEDEAVQAGEDFKELVKNLNDPQALHFTLPSLLRANLRAYQEKGYQWLAALDYYGFGGVLADDMGLGKTVQTIAFLCHKLEQTTDSIFIIICPSSVLYNWAYEFAKFAPDVKVQIISGSASERKSLIEATLKDDTVRIMLTSYPLIQRDIEYYQVADFETVILDEAQNVKNWATKTAQAIRQLRRRNVIGLSGTPIENRLDELWSLFAIVQPGLFPSLRKFRQLPRDIIAKKVNFFILRRLKKDVLADLPPKMETTQHIELADEQKKIYQIQLNMIRQNVSEIIEKDAFDQNRIQILAGMTRLRQICNDPRLVYADYQGSSAKLTRLLEYLDECLQTGKRVVVFSQFTQMLALIRHELDQRDWGYHYLDGQTAKEDRLTLAERFNQGEKEIFLISLRAGGTGLNLTGGDTVLLYDSWWNPAVEDQAADRVHRFGQQNKVDVVRFITNGTIEEGISQLQAQKRELIDSVIHADSDKSVASLSQEDILDLLGV